MPDDPDSSASASLDSLPEYIAHYRILRRLGKGGMGEVFLGEDTKQHGRKVALKVLPEEVTRSGELVATLQARGTRHSRPESP